MCQIAEKLGFRFDYHIKMFAKSLLAYFSFKTATLDLEPTHDTKILKRPVSLIFWNPDVTHGTAKSVVQMNGREMKPKL
jgi:hypothetical protein